METEIKECTTCKTLKPLSSYSTYKTKYSFGYRSDCRLCINAYQKQYKVLNKDILKKKSINSYEVDKERHMWHAAKKRAKQKGLDFSIEVSDINIPKVCPILEIPLIRNNRGTKCGDSPSLDRIDTTKGYIKGNVWVISHRANTAKWNLTSKELLIFSKNILRLIK